MKQPTIEQNVKRQGRTGLLVVTPFDELFVDKLKSQVPTLDRWWTGDAWFVTSEHMDLVVSLCLQHFGGLMLLGGDGEEDRIVDRSGSTAQGRLL